jgi:hypothetical protein
MVNNKRIYEQDQEQTEIINNLMVLVDKEGWPEAKMYNLIRLLTALSATGATLVNKTGPVATWKVLFGNGAWFQFTVNDGENGAQGESGINAPVPVMQYSINGSTDWHSIMDLQNDRYARMSVDGENSWSSAWYIMAQDGINGIDGSNGADAPETLLRYSANQIDWHDTANILVDTHVQFSTDNGASWYPNGGFYIRAKELSRRIEFSLIGHTEIESLISDVEAENIVSISRIKNIKNLKLVNQATPFNEINIVVNSINQAIPIAVPLGDYKFTIEYITSANGVIKLLTEKA